MEDFDDIVFPPTDGTLPVVDYPVTMRQAGEVILHARGGVPVPNGIVVASLDDDNHLHWFAGAPFPERFPKALANEVTIIDCTQSFGDVTVGSDRTIFSVVSSIAAS